MLGVVICGISHWQEWTRPLITQIRLCEPSVPIVVVDAEGNYPKDPRVTMIAIERHSYARSMNIGIRALSDCNRFLILNNDVLCLERFDGKVKQLPEDSFGGNALNHKFGDYWVDGWSWYISRKVWETVGEFDEKFLVAGFEDADYTFRAQAAGFTLVQTHLPFRHLAQRIRWDQHGYKKQRMRNLMYLIEKHDLKWGLWGPE